MYKIGDKVKIVGGDSSYWKERQNWIGKICIVDEIDDSNRGVLVHSADNIVGSSWLLQTSVKHIIKENEQLLLFELV